MEAVDGTQHATCIIRLHARVNIKNSGGDRQICLAHLMCGSNRRWSTLSGFASAMRVTSYFGSIVPWEATSCQRPLWFTNTSVHRVFPLMSFPLYVPLSLLL